MSRQNITDEIVIGLEFALACVNDRRIDSHAKRIRTYDAKYTAAIAAINAITSAHAAAVKKKGVKTRAGYRARKAYPWNQ